MDNSLLLPGARTTAWDRISARRLRNPNRLVLWFILSIPIVWVLGVAPLAAFCFAALFLRYRSRPRAPEIALLTIGTAFLLSLVIAAGKGEPADRLVAAGYNLIVLLCACVALNFGRQVDFTFARTPSLRTPAVAFFFAFAASIAVAYVVGAPSVREGVAFPSLLTGQLGEDLPGLLGYYATARLTGPDWSDGSSLVRPLAFGVYFNEGALMFLLSGIIALLASRAKLVSYAAATCLIAGLFMLRSRMLFLASMLASIVAIIARAPAAREVRLLIATVGLLGAILLCVLNPDKVDSFIDQIIMSRGPSSAARFHSYSVAFDVTWRESPIFGLGIKPREDALSTPIGSHSTIVSAFTKGGLLALVPLLFFYVFVVIASFRLLFLDHSAGSYRNAQALLGATALVILAWMLVEDFDAPIYGSMMAFVVLGSAFGLLERLTKYERLRSTDPYSTADPLDTVRCEGASTGWLALDDACLHRRLH